ncbi:MAG: hypothetical protein JOZ17_01930 [Acetobacteraceae bacterium]|nr:hypothetical protein [Acetobacteraceae bacterium]
MRTKTGETVSVITVAALMLTLGFVTFAGALRLAESAAEMALQDGDMMHLTTSHRWTRTAQSRLTVERQGESGCVLDLGVMAGSGGSVLIISRSARPHRIYHVQWSGPRTSEGSGDCGRSAELIVNDDELELLASAAAGWGLGLRGSRGVETTLF